MVLVDVKFINLKPVLGHILGVAPVHADVEISEDAETLIKDNVSVQSVLEAEVVVAVDVGVTTISEIQEIFEVVALKDSTETDLVVVVVVEDHLEDSTTEVSQEVQKDRQTDTRHLVNDEVVMMIEEAMHVGLKANQ